MSRVLSFLIRYFSNYYTLHRSDLAARAVPLDPRLEDVKKYKKLFLQTVPIMSKKKEKKKSIIIIYH